MKLKLYIPILALCLCIMYGCYLGPWTEIYWFYESFIVAYVNVDYSEDVEVSRIPLQSRCVSVIIPTEIHAHYVFDGFSERWKQDNPDWELWHERHRELSRKNGDVGFDREVDVTNYVHNPKVWNTDNLISTMYVVSNADYDDVHLAGVSMNDIVEITYSTHKPFIENGYKHTDANRSVNDYSGDWVTKRLSELQPEDSIFMEAGYFSLRFVEQPTAAQSHTFTVTIEFEHGEPYSFSFDMDFPSAE